MSGLFLPLEFDVAVGLSVGKEYVLWKNGRLERDAIWRSELVHGRNRVLDWGPDSPG